MIKCNLSRMMDKRHVKVSNVARETGIHRGTITRLTNNSAVRVDFEVLEKLCCYMDCEICDLLEIQ